MTRRTRRQPRVRAGAAAALIALAACEEQRDDAGDAQLTAQRDRMVQQLSSWADSLDPGSADRACDANLKKAQTGPVPAVRLAHLRAAPAPAPADDRWRFLTSSEGSKLLPEKEQRPLDYVYGRKKLAERTRVVAVIRIDSVTEPRMDGERFHAGQLRATIELLDLDTLKSACRARVTVDSDSDVTLAADASADAALRHAFDNRIKNELDRAVRRMLDRPLDSGH